MCALKQGQKAGKSVYGCVGCRKPFHINCFSIYHCSNFGAAHNEAEDLLKENISDPTKKRAFQRISKLVPLTLDAVEPVYKKQRQNTPQQEPLTQTEPMEEDQESDDEALTVNRER